MQIFFYANVVYVIDKNEKRKQKASEIERERETGGRKMAWRSNK